MSLIITEGSRSDISTVYAYYIDPEQYPNGNPKMCESYSAFNDCYKIGDEREFINHLEHTHPNTFSHYHIGWSNAN